MQIQMESSIIAVTCEDQNQTILRVPISRRTDLFEPLYNALGGRGPS
jgi:hypothetical protein